MPEAVDRDWADVREARIIALEMSARIAAAPRNTSLEPEHILARAETFERWLLR